MVRGHSQKASQLRSWQAWWRRYTVPVMELSQSCRKHMAIQIKRMGKKETLKHTVDCGFDTAIGDATDCRGRPMLSRLCAYVWVCVRLWSNCIINTTKYVKVTATRQYQESNLYCRPNISWCMVCYFTCIIDSDPQLHSATEYNSESVNHRVQ